MINWLFVFFNNLEEVVKNLSVGRHACDARGGRLMGCDCINHMYERVLPVLSQDDVGKSLEYGTQTQSSMTLSQERPTL